MPPRQRVQNNPNKSHTTSSSNDMKQTDLKSQQKNKLEKEVKEKLRQKAVNAYFPPLPLVLTILICSGFMWMLAFRDMMATGKSLIGPMDDAFLVSFI